MSACLFLRANWTRSRIKRVLLWCAHGRVDIDRVQDRRAAITAQACLLSEPLTCSAFQPSLCRASSCCPRKHTDKTWGLPERLWVRERERSVISNDSWMSKSYVNTSVFEMWTPPYQRSFHVPSVSNSWTTIILFLTALLIRNGHVNTIPWLP